MGRYWDYFDADGKRITDRDEIDRLNAIGLPPAYRERLVLRRSRTAISRRPARCARAASNIATTPPSARSGRAPKYDGLLEFGKALPKLRRRVEQDLKRRKLSRDTVLAAVVRLLDTEHIRIGNEAYAQATTRAIGATTLRDRHVKAQGPAR